MSEKIQNQNSTKMENFQQKAFDIQQEIDLENAQNAEDKDNELSEEIPLLDYSKMTLEKLTEEFEKILKNHKVQAIKEHAEEIRKVFNEKYSNLFEQKKQSFLEEGGEEKDFVFKPVFYKNFTSLFNEYKQKRSAYYKELDKNHQQNLEQKQLVINQIKDLILEIETKQTDIRSVDKKFRDLKEKFYSIGAIPRDDYNHIWNDFHFQCERFYDYLDAYRDLRDLEFRRNLERKKQLIKEAESLLDETDIPLAYRKLRQLHRIWKEQTGAVDKEHRQKIWETFLDISEKIHKKRADYLVALESTFEENAKTRQAIISLINKALQQEHTTHEEWQKAIQSVGNLRDEFVKTGRVPEHLSDTIWQEYRQVVVKFNKKKNEFYKNFKKIQQEILDKKKALIQFVKTTKENENWEETLPIMKKVQEDWKKLGGSFRYSDKLWKEFKHECDEYYVNFKKFKDTLKEGEVEIFTKKQALLEELKEFKLTENLDESLEKVKNYIRLWTELGKTPKQKYEIEVRFNKIINALFKKLDVDKQKAELFKYTERLEQLAEGENQNSINSELVFLNKKIETTNAELLQIENNLSFFTKIDEKNPLIREVLKKKETLKSSLDMWKAKLKELKSLQKELQDNA